MVNERWIHLGPTLWAEAAFLLCELAWEKYSLCEQPFKSVQKSGRINLKKRFFPVLDLFRALRESCVADQSCRNYLLFRRNSRHLMTDLTINFACESRDEFRAFTIENWTLVDRGYFLHNTSHREIVASACGVLGPFCAVELWVILKTCKGSNIFPILKVIIIIYYIYHW